MPFTNSVAASYGLLAMHAMDMYRIDAKNPTPTPDPKLKPKGWTVIGYVNARDTLFPPGVRVGKLPLQVLQTRVYYGYLAQNDANEFVVVVRGTDGLVEWLEDGEFPPIAYAPQTPLPYGPPAAQVEQGFYSIYSSMTLLDVHGAPLGPIVPAIVKHLQPDKAKITVIGHSLGSALATYLTLELAQAAPDRASVQACLFASPRTGNQTFVEAFDKIVVEYRLFNYQLDIVPRVPLGFDYHPLPRHTVLQPSTAEANIRLDIGCNHHVVCYCAMLDYEGTMRQIDPPPPGEEGSARCILGPETGAPSIGKIMAGTLGGLIPV